MNYTKQLTALMLRVFLTLSLIVGVAYYSTAQSIDSLYQKEINQQPTEYSYPYKGKQVPVYKGKNGGYYIICKSENTGKEYKRYLKLEQILAKKDTYI